MNDKDKEAFDQWWDRRRYGSSCYYWHKRSLIGDELSSTWEAACNYKQKGIDELNEWINIAIEHRRTAKELQTENAKLKECVEFYADRFSWTESEHPTHEYYAGSIRNDDSLVEYTEADGDVFKDFCGGKRARQVLKELGEK